jgi:hypothetical protein
MDEKTAKLRYATHKSNAKRRGIEWLFSYETWREWWGKDIDERGPGRFELSMQRFEDKGPYAPWNVRKGYPKDNGVTRGAMYQRRVWEETARVCRAEQMQYLEDQGPDDRPERDELGYTMPRYC